MTLKTFTVKTAAVLTKKEPEPEAVPRKKQAETSYTGRKRHL